VLILTSYALGGLGFSLLMPPWEAPDETMHYSRILSYSDFWAGPRNYEARQPPLYYWLAAGPIQLRGGIDLDLVKAVVPRPLKNELPLRSSPDQALLSLDPQVLSLE
jgi:hypothetical protein